jgi:RHS repeat-associated protein
VWGTDLSGSEQGAGGVGGLLMVRNYVTTNNQSATHFAAYDGNGNVTGLVDASDGAVSATYEYGPFGELIRSTGGMVSANPFRFSTKFTDNESGLVYYGYRYYNPSAGRWQNRDPIHEFGGLNLLNFVGNRGVNAVDFLGLSQQLTGTNGSQTINVRLCQVVVLVGHGDYYRPQTFNFPSDTCSAGGFIGCGAGSTNERIREGNKIAGAPNWTEDVFNSDPAYTKAWPEIKQGAKDKANSICHDSKCHCKEVTIIYLYAPAHDALIDTLQRPSLPSAQTIPCDK